MARLNWDRPGERRYETGVDRGVLYRQASNGKYSTGEAWNGLTAVTESPSGAEANPQYADNIKYLNLISAEQFGGTIEAFTYPTSFQECDGTKVITEGVTIGQQTRRPFGLSYRTRVGNDIEGTDFGYKLHLVYAALAAPSEKAYSTINDSPEALAFSWEFSTTPIDTGDDHKPTATITIDTTLVPAAKVKELEDILYGTASESPRLPTPEEVFAIFEGTTVAVVPEKPAYDEASKTITIPTVTGVEYFDDGEVVTGTIVLSTSETKLITAMPTVGYKFAPNTDNDWLFEG